MKMTMTDGTVFEGTLKEYAELVAFAETHQTINEAKVEAEESKPKLKAGDFVKFEERDLLDITVGKIYEVLADEYGDLCILDDEGDEDYSYLAQFAIKVDAEDVKWAKIGRKVNEYKVGDVIRIVDETGGYDEGEIAIISEIDDDNIWYDDARKKRGEGNRWHTYADFIELVAPVESTLN